MVKKLIPFLMVIVAICCAIPVWGDSSPSSQKKIPVKLIRTQPTTRELQFIPLQACYDGMSSAIYTTVTSDLGEIEMTVTNLSTGEVWSDTFDSGVIMQTLLPVSGAPGYYEIEYITESGDAYAGEFLIE